MPPIKITKSTRPSDGEPVISLQIQPPPLLPVLGIDVAKATLRSCVMFGGKILAEADFANTDHGFKLMQKWLRDSGAPLVRAGLEATGRYSQGVLTFLHDAGHQACLINPRRIKDYARSEGRRNKTDPADARVIARFVNTHELRTWQPPPPERQRLQALQRRRGQVVAMMVAEHLHFQDADASVKPLVEASLKQMKDQLRSLEADVKALIQSDPGLRRQRDLLLSIPGVGLVTAATILSELPPIEQFEKVRDLAAWAGLTPSLFESGTSVRGRSRMSKQGNGRLRRAFYMPAVTQLRSKADNPLTAFARRLEAAGKPPMVVIGALMRKLFQTACGVLKNETEFDPRHGMPGEPAPAM